MFRKFIVIGIFFLMAPIAFAATGAVTKVAPKYYDGFFVGAGVGLMATSFSYSSLSTIGYTNPLTFLSNDISFSAGSSNEDVIGELHFGYGHQIGRRFYLGGAIGANFASHRPNGVVRNAVLAIPRATVPLSDTLTLRNSAHLRDIEVSVDLRPGLLFSPNSLLYFVIGAAFNNVKYRVSSDFTNSSIPLTYSVSSAVSKNIEGLRAGVGLQEMLGHSVAFFLQYVYTRYASQAIGSSAFFVSPITGQDSMTVNGTARPTRHSILLGADWYFSQ